MATIEYLAAVQFSDIRSASYDLLDHDDAYAEVYFSVQSELYTLWGRDFLYDDGRLTGGTVLEFMIDVEGTDYLKVTDIEYDVALLSSMSMPNSGDDTIIGSSDGDRISGGNGNDVISGNGGNDIVGGGPGRNTMSGGGGSDIFYFRGGRRDVVEDFDALGGGDRQDYLWISDDYRIREKAGDTILIYGDKHKVVLLDVAADDISKADFRDEPW